MLNHILNRFYNFIIFAKSFFPQHLRPQLKELYSSIAILDFAVSAVMIFEPIYLYTLGWKIYQIMLFYMFAYLVYFVILPLGGKIAKQQGFEHSIMYGSFFLILYYIFLFNIPAGSGFIFLAIIALAIQKTLFWPGYHADFAFFGQCNERGRQISGLVIVDSLVYVLGPLFGGLIISLFGFKVLFIIVCFIILISNIPYFSLQESFTPSIFKYKDCYKRLFAKENRKYFLGYLGYAEELVVITIWPLFMYVILQNTAGIGSLIALTTLITTVVVLVIGRATDTTDRKQVLRTGAIFYSLAWFLRLIVRGPGTIFMIDFFSRTSKNLVSVPLIAGLYEHAIKTSIVKSVIFFEMTLVIGKVVIAALLAIIFYFSPNAWNAAFIIGGIASLFYLFLTLDNKQFAKFFLRK